MDKKIVIYVQQTSNKELAIERYVVSLCFQSCSIMAHFLGFVPRYVAFACTSSHTRQTHGIISVLLYS